MNRFLILAYGIFAYAAFLCTILYMIGFIGAVIVPKNIDTGIQVSLPEAALVDLALILLFGVSHSVMARPAFKQQLTKFIPHAAERSTFVLVASLVLAILYWQWRPIDTVIWTSSAPVSWLLFGVSMVGWLVVFLSTFLIDHFDLFGLRQVWLNFRGLEYSQRPFVLRGLYKFVRHPLMLGFLIAFWFAPAMTIGHLLFAIAMTIYIFVGIFYEERDLAKMLGEDYLRYKAQTSMIFPIKWSKKKQ
jgi:protein-S-isoprenylcysteine O-methyltransferase Ste14